MYQLRLALLMIFCGIMQAKEVSFKVYDESFNTLIDTTKQPVVLYDKGIWLEGPQVLPNGNVIVSDVKANKVLEVRINQDDVTRSKIHTWLMPSHFQNGHTLDREGRIIAASHGKRAIERLNTQGKAEWEVLIDSSQNKKFNSPNDVIVDSDGDIWFSDPKFGLLNPLEGYRGEAEQEGEFIYRYSSHTKTIVRLRTPLLRTPNGLALSPDEKILYIADSELAYNVNDKGLKHQILAYNIDKDKTLRKGRVFVVIESGFPDGIKVDKQGNVWSSSQSGIQVFSPKGKVIGEIILPQVVGNFAFSLNDEALATLQK
ncbi:SMP-30/gluconolactonase/LRE family protein [uncultured Helicobacter sp.]|uniref:SMP-30/gluconolactonase/LRE family protein n=1 Tax=uncultured Helicobacter sp. TaxID=175537 RepID=UPI00263BE434|nr:SMP-30/gluconolactonase/LRE family protein [uncultured Helicobacter sp.]